MVRGNRCQPVVAADDKIRLATWRSRSRHPKTIKQCTKRRFRYAIFVMIELSRQQLDCSGAYPEAVLLNARNLVALDVAEVQVGKRNILRQTNSFFLQPSVGSFPDADDDVGLFFLHP